ncbi:MAG: acyl-CoA dehydrogenase, partial [Bacteroidota bacterium]|nr:acyl-CoA dehydrogenase [Bacteroidota bacterium]
IARLKKVFLMVAGSAVQKFGPDLEKHQMLLMAASDILIQIYMAESTILRTEKNAKRFGEEAQATQIAMSKLYLYRAVDIIQQKAKEGIVSFAEGDEQRMMLMGLKRFTKYTNQPNVVELRTQIADKVAADNGYTFD